MEPTSVQQPTLPPNPFIASDGNPTSFIPSDTFHLIFSYLENRDFQNTGRVCKRWLNERRVVAPSLSAENQRKLIGVAMEFFELRMAELENSIGKPLDFASINPRDSDHLDLFALKCIKDELNELTQTTRIPSDVVPTHQALRNAEENLFNRLEAIRSRLSADRKESLGSILASHKALLWYYRWPENVSSTPSTFENVEKELAWIEFRVEQFSKRLFAEEKYTEGAKLIDSQTLSPQKRAGLKLPLIAVYAQNPARLKELLGDSLTLAAVENAICEQAQTAVSERNFKKAVELLKLISPTAPTIIERLNTICLQLIKENEIHYAMEIALRITAPKLAKFSNILEYVSINEQTFDNLFGEICAKKGIEIGLFAFETFQKNFIVRGSHEEVLAITKRYADILTILKLAALYLGLGQNEHFTKTIQSLPEGPFKTSYNHSKETSEKKLYS